MDSSACSDDLLTGQFDMNAIQENLSDSDVLALCQPYEPLLEFDPLNPDHAIDPRYTVIHPTLQTSPVGVSLYSYRFLQRVVEKYGRGIVSLSPHITVNLGG